MKKKSSRKFIRITLSVMIVLFINISDMSYSQSVFMKSDNARMNYKNGVLQTTVVMTDSGLPYKEIYHGWAEGVGVNKAYYKDGTLKAVYDFKGGRIVSYKKFNRKGSLLFESIIENQSDRKDFEYDENGKLKRELDYAYYMPTYGK